jgi:hypothetical protein
VRRFTGRADLPPLGYAVGSSFAFQRSDLESEAGSGHGRSCFVGNPCMRKRSLRLSRCVLSHALRFRLEHRLRRYAVGHIRIVGQQCLGNLPTIEDAIQRLSLRVSHARPWCLWEPTHTVIVVRRRRRTAPRSCAVLPYGAAATTREIMRLTHLTR